MLETRLQARIDDENAGRYRQTPVRITGSTHEPAPTWDIAARMEAWQAWLKEQEDRQEPVSLAAIHPFIGGNGRTARLEAVKRGRAWHTSQKALAAMWLRLVKICRLVAERASEDALLLNGNDV